MNAMRALLVLLSAAVAAVAAFCMVYGLQAPVMFAVEVGVIAVSVAVFVAALVMTEP